MRWRPLPFVGTAYADESKPFASQDCVNLLPEAPEAPGTRSPSMLRCVPGWYDFAYPGDGPIRGARNVEGKFFVVSGSEFGQIDSNGGFTVLGTIPGTTRCSLSHNQITGGNEVLILNGTDGFTYNTANGDFDKINDAAYPGGIVGDFVGQYLVQVEPSRRYWFHSDLAAAREYSSIDRAEAEASPDRIVSLVVDHGRLLVFGERTTEEYANIPVGASAFSRTGTVIERGCAAPHTVVQIDNSVIFLGEDGIVYRLEGVTPVRISTYPIEQAIARCSLSKAFALKWEDRGHKVYYLTFQDGQTWGYDCATRLWHRRESFGLNRWRANTLTLWRNRWYAGDFSTGTIYALDWDVQAESESNLVREFSMPVAHDDQNRMVFNALDLLLDVGMADAEPPLRIVGTLPDEEEGTAYSNTLLILGGTAPYSVAIASGALPTGGTIGVSGTTITVAWADDVDIGVYEFTVQVTDAAGRIVTSRQSVEVTTTLAVFGVLTDGEEGVAYEQRLTITGGITPYANVTVASGALPTGGTATLDGDEIVVAIPDTAPDGDYTFTLSVDDANGCTATSAQAMSLAASPGTVGSHVWVGSGGNAKQIQTSDNTVADTVPLSRNSAYSIVLSPDGAYAYVSHNDAAGGIDRIDLSDNTLDASVAVTSPYELAVAADGTVVAMRSGGLLQFFTPGLVSLGTLTVATGANYNVCMAPDGETLYAACWGNNRIKKVDVASRSVLSTISIGGVFPRGIAVTPDGNELWICDDLHDKVRIVTLSTGTLVTTPITVGDRPYEIDFNPSGSHAFVVCRTGDILYAINVATRTVTDTLAVGNAPETIAVNPSGARAYVANFDDGTVSVINIEDPTNLSTTTTVASIPNSAGLAVTPT